MIVECQTAFGRGSKRKPYDAEIEYLESTGTQWIDLGLNSTADKFCDFDIVFRKTTVGNNLGTAGNDAPLSYCYASTARYGIWGKGTTLDTDGVLWVGVNKTNSVQMSKDTEWHSVKIRNGQYVEIDGAQTPVASGTVRANINLLLFAVVTSASASSSYRVVPSEVASVKIWSTDGVLLRDLIPVRKGNIGYMYDRVSGQLFGNQGTGEFVLGPDIIDYTAKDSILDGTVAMWDGVENAGLGEHDDNFVGLKDLVGTKDLTLSGDNFLLDNGVDFQGSLSWQFDTDTIPTEDFTFKVVHDRTNTSGNTCVFGLGHITQRLFTASKTQIGYRFGPGYINADNSDTKTQVIYIRRDSKMSVYINGIKAVEQAALYSPIGYTDIAINGENAYGNYKNRITINNMMIVSRAITEDEITYLYNIDKQRFGL